MVMSMDIILIMIMIRLSKRIMAIMKMVMMFCMPELARILKQQSYPNGAPCHISIPLAQMQKTIEEITVYITMNRLGSNDKSEAGPGGSYSSGIAGIEFGETFS